jgi:shikimate dehydrogenase
MSKKASTTRVCFLLGYPLGHTRSPSMHNAAFAALGLDYRYVPLEVKPEGLSAVFSALRIMENFGGANVTVPHKVAAMELVDGRTEEAERIGAVNTLFWRDRELWGDNTDAQGFLSSLVEDLGFHPRGRRVMVLGAGGAARAVLCALIGAGVEEIYVVNRTVERAQELAQRYGKVKEAPTLVPLGFFDSRFRSALKGCDLLINSTSVGLSRDDPPLFDYDLLPPGIAVCDLIYEPPLTPLLEAARGKGCRILNGLGMLVRQGALSFHLWTGKEPPLEEMRGAVGNSLDRLGA